MKREYTYKAILNPEYILYIRYENGQYAVYVRNEDGTRDYLVYGGYKALGTAENRLLASARSYHTNPVNYSVAPREAIQNGIF